MSLTSPLLTSWITSDSARAFVGLMGSCSAVLLPLTQVNPLYGITVGYGTSVATAAWVSGAAWGINNNKHVTASSLHLATITYGVRLTAFLVLRLVMGWRSLPSDGWKDMARWKRVTFATSLAAYYACLTTPLWSVLRNSSSQTTTMRTGITASANKWEMIGLTLTWTGLVLQIVADIHKSWVKEMARRQRKQSSSSADGNKKNDDDETSIFDGPTTGVYRLVRHPNYLGEVLFWWGAAVAAVPSLTVAPVWTWLTTALGSLGIGAIMRGATARLESNQAANYKGQAKYDAWCAAVPYPWIPLVRG